MKKLILVLITLVTLQGLANAASVGLNAQSSATPVDADYLGFGDLSETNGGSTTFGNFFTNYLTGKINTWLATKDGSDIAITDSGGYFTGTDVEAALQEIGLALDGKQAANGFLSDIAALSPSAGDLIYYDGADFVVLNIGSNGEYLGVNSGALTWGSPSGSGDVTASATFNTDNVLIKSDGTSKGVQATGIVVDDSDNMTSIGGMSLARSTVGPDPNVTYEDDDNGDGYTGWGAAASITNDLMCSVPATADPLANQIMLFAAPASVTYRDNVARDTSQGSWGYAGYKATASKSSAYTIGTDDAREAYGGTIYVTSAATITAPAVVAGMHFSVVTIGATAVNLDVNASDRMYLDGTALSDGDQATNTSTTGDLIHCEYESADGWYCASGSPDGDHWTDGN